MYKDPTYDGPLFDWPDYAAVTETPEQVRECRRQYAALLSFCDYSLGRVMDKMDELGLWDDTLFIVNTDHGFLLGEHNNWAKVHVPYYQEIAHIPFFIWDPRYKISGERRSALASNIDIPATILDYFNLDLPSDMQGRPIKNIVSRDEKLRDAVLFGMHGAHVNLADGKYVYMRGPASKDNQPKYNYTLMPTRMERRYQIDELRNMDGTLSDPFSFTKGCRLLRIPCPSRYEPQKGQVIDPFALAGTAVFDIEKDPGQLNPVNDSDLEEKLRLQMIELMKENDSPEEQFIRLGLV
ncbi:MAG: sulfatase-like hydrolase/transferase [Treponema sp.]|nr:sulfatase-like hydrolase/transferase [Treponema sp.]